MEKKLKKTKKLPLQDEISRNLLAEEKFPSFLMEENLLEKKYFFRGGIIHCGGNFYIRIKKNSRKHK